MCFSRVTPDRMHVLKIVPWLFWPDGRVVGRYFLEQSAALMEAGLKVRILHPSQRSLASFARSGSERHRFQNAFQRSPEGIDVFTNWGWRVPKAYRLSSRILRWQLERLIEDYEKEFGTPDLIHSESALTTGIVAARLARRCSVPLVVTEHQTYFLSNELSAVQACAVRSALDAATEITAVSDALADILARYSDGKLVQVLPNMVDTDFFSPPSHRSHVPFVISTVCHLVKRKRVDLLIRAFAKAFGKLHDVRLHVVGDGTERRNLESLCRRHGISEQATFFGHVDRRMVRDVLRDSNLFVLPSRHETFGVVLIEALATGLRVINLANGGAQDVVKKVGGTNLPTDDFGVLAEELIRHHRSVSVDDVDIAASNKVREIYGKESFTEKWLVVYQRAIEWRLAQARSTRS